jgi:hypothetical protein
LVRGLQSPQLESGEAGDPRRKGGGNHRVHAGILINGKQPEKDFIRQILNNTYWLRERITQISGVQPWITPVLVFTNAFVPYSKPVKNIHVINQRYLVKTIKEKTKVDEVNTRIWQAREKIAEGLTKTQ